jgi:hypothetical protein
VSKWKLETGTAAIAGRCRRVQVLVALVPIALSAGCAPVVTLEGERIALRSERFAEYVEHVFREQNRVATELAFALEDATDTERRDALESAEETLLTACGGLNELAAARRDGERLGAVRGLAAARAAPDCERASADAAALL